MFDVVVIGGGPAGMAAALEVCEQKGSVLIIERERELGGILKQCIHDGFGIVKFNEKLTGPEYAERYSRKVLASDIDIKLNTFVIEICKRDVGFKIEIMNSDEGVQEIGAKSVVLANGCRERTAKQILINGTRPAGVYTAGTAQNLINIKGGLPCEKCVVLGSGDIGLIMARRLTLEGANVIGVYEVKSEPSGLTRNIVQCLEDYNIPLHLNKTIRRVFGDHRVEGVEICDVDENMRAIRGTEKRIECDGVILSVGLIPENEIAELLGAEMDKRTRGPIVSEDMMTSVGGVFSCGNALHVNDLVDFVSDSGEIAGRSALEYSRGERRENTGIIVDCDNQFLYVIPQKLSKNESGDIEFYFRSRRELIKPLVKIYSGTKVIFQKRYRFLRPPEMERITIPYEDIVENIRFEIEEVDNNEG